MRMGRVDCDMELTNCTHVADERKLAKEKTQSPMAPDWCGVIWIKILSLRSHHLWIKASSLIEDLSKKILAEIKWLGK